MSAVNLRPSPLSLLATISGAALLLVLQTSDAAIVVKNSMWQDQVAYSEESGTQTSFGDESGRVCTSVIDFDSSDNDDDSSALYPLNFSYPFILSNLNGSTVQESYEHVRWQTNGCVYLGQLDYVSEEYDACQPGKSKLAMNSTCGIQEYEYFWAEEALEDSSFSYTNGDKAVPPIICPTQTDLDPSYGGWYSIHHCNDMTYVKSNQIAHIDFGDYVEDYGEACVFNWEVGFFKDGSLEIRFFDMCTVYQDTGEEVGAVTISGGNLSNPINVCGPNCTCWDGWGGNYRITVANESSPGTTVAPTTTPDLTVVKDEYMFQGQVVYSEQSGTQTSFGIESGRVCTSVIDYESTDNDDDHSALYPLNFSYPFILSNLNSNVQESYDHVKWQTNGCVYLGQLDYVSEEYDACQPGKSKQAMNSTCGIQEYEYFWAEEALEDSSFSYMNGDKAVPPIICPQQTDLDPGYGGWYSIHHCNDMTYVKANYISHIDISDYLEDYGEPCIFNWEVGFFPDGSLEIRFFDMCTVYQDTGEATGAVTISGRNLSNPINVCGPNCTCWDGWGGDYRITVANSRVTESPTVFCRDDNDCGSEEYCYCSGEEEAARRRRKLRAAGSKGGGTKSGKSGRKASSSASAAVKKGRHSGNRGGFGGHSSAKTHHQAGKRSLLFTADSCYCVDNSQ